jgi:hypothetical protein
MRSGFVAVAILFSMAVATASESIYPREKKHHAISPPMERGTERISVPAATLLPAGSTCRASRTSLMPGLVIDPSTCVVTSGTISEAAVQ